MAVRPVVRHFIACRKEPTAKGPVITLNDVFIYAIKPKQGYQYPVWHRTFFLFAIVTNGLGRCSFKVVVRFVEMDDIEEKMIGESQAALFDFGNHRLKVWPLSFMMPPILLPQAGVYRLYLTCDGEPIACEEIHAR